MDKLLTNLLTGIVKLVLPILCAVTCVAQAGGDAFKIAASQSVSSPLLFVLADDGLPAVQAVSSIEGKDFTARNGLPNFFHKLALGSGEVVVAFIGGSITQSDHGYRLQTARYLEKIYPTTRFKWVNAGISGTGTDLGAFRVREHVLAHQPDLVFVEFAVNGAYQPGMEGIIRQLIEHDPMTDICLLYTAAAADLNVYQQGGVPAHIGGLERIAEHYRLPSVHLGRQPALMVKERRLVWMADNNKGNNSLLVFSKDGIHPSPQGGDMYAGILAGSLQAMNAIAPPQRHRLPHPIMCDKWDAAGMYQPDQIGTYDTTWRNWPTRGSHLDRFSGWFDTLMVAEKAGARYTFHFEGDMFGLFDIGGPEVGQLNVWVDDSLVSLTPFEVSGRIYKAELSGDEKTPLNRFNRFCNNRYRGQYDIITVPFGYHKVTLEISAVQADKRGILGSNQWDDIMKDPAKYERSAIYLGRILLRGRPVTDGWDDEFEK